MAALCETLTRILVQLLIDVWHRDIETIALCRCFFNVTLSLVQIFLRSGEENKSFNRFPLLYVCHIQIVNLIFKSLANVTVFADLYIPISPLIHIVEINSLRKKKIDRLDRLSNEAATPLHLLPAERLHCLQIETHFS